MKVLAAGGGSGGHVTPVLAVLNELSQHTPELEVRFVCDQAFANQARQVMAGADSEVAVQAIYAGKWRRYHGISPLRQLLDVRTTAYNLRDSLYLALGTMQSLWLVFRWRPDVVFTKGGFVCVPVGIAARLFRVPIVMHDSDAHPGLANRILARWAARIATGSPLKYYRYPKAISRYVGVPVGRQFHRFSAQERQAARRSLELPDTDRPLLVVTGGGLGAKRINDAILELAPRLVDELDMSVLHITGKDEYPRCQQLAYDSVHYQQRPFVAEGMAQLLGAADIVVTRAGATTMLELAALGAAVIIIPHPYLSGGHQLKNAAVYREAEAALVVNEADLQPSADVLYRSIESLLSNKERRNQLSDKLAGLARPEAANQVAKMIIEVSL